MGLVHFCLSACLRDLQDPQLRSELHKNRRESEIIFRGTFFIKLLFSYLSVEKSLIHSVD